MENEASLFPFFLLSRLFNNDSRQAPVKCPDPCPSCAPQIPSPTCPEQPIITINIQDLTTKKRLTDDILKTIILALNQQLRDFQKVYSEPVLYQTQLVREAPPTPSKYTLYFKDDVDINGAFGYHTFDQKNPENIIAYVFVETILAKGGKVLTKGNTRSVSVSKIASHEILEMINNPHVNSYYVGDLPLYRIMDPDTSEVVDIKTIIPNLGNTVIKSDGSQYLNVFVRYEICDPVQSNNVALTINGITVEVSDFVFPGWFSPIENAGPYNYNKTLTRSFDLDVGGYVNFIYVKNNKVYNMIK